LEAVVEVDRLLDQQQMVATQYSLQLLLLVEVGVRQIDHKEASQ
jgi:hypothetical protein